MKKLAIVAALGALCACASHAEKNPLKGHGFVSVQDETRITLNFDKEKPKLYGKVVNSYNAPYELAGDNIIISRTASTMMMPIGKAAEVERDYFKFIGTGKPMTYSLNGDTLSITNSAGKEMKFEKVK